MSDAYIIITQYLRSALWDSNKKNIELEEKLTKCQDKQNHKQALVTKLRRQLTHMTSQSQKDKARTSVAKADRLNFARKLADGGGK
jgi:peptidoglycan hydrolase CwlO-like protein